MNPTDALQYVAAVCGDFIRTLPPSSQGPTTQAINQALAVLQPLTQSTGALMSPADNPAPTE